MIPENSNHNDLLKSASVYAAAASVPGIHAHTRNLCSYLARVYQEEAEELQQSNKKGELI
jgi:hypothetical protein